MTVVTRREHNLVPFVRRIRDSINNQFQGITTNGLLLRSVPLGVVTVAYPVVAPAGTITVNLLCRPLRSIEQHADVMAVGVDCRHIWLQV